jgi:hypothetical protein
MVSRSQVFYELQVADVDTPDTIRPRCTETNRELRLNNAYTVTSIHSIVTFLGDRHGKVIPRDLFLACNASSM